MASREVLVVLLMCVVVSIHAAPLAHSRFLRAFSPLLNVKRQASSGSYGNTYGSSMGGYPSYMGNNAGYPSYMSGNFGSNGFQSSQGGGSTSTDNTGFGTPAGLAHAMQLVMTNGCDDPLIGKLTAAVAKLASSRFMESDQMESVVGDKGQMMDHISEEDLGMAACVIGNIKSLDDVVAIADMKAEDEANFRMMYPIYASMAPSLIGMLEGEMGSIDDEQALEGITVLKEIYDIVVEMGLLELQ